jgi:hypothetical protein
MAPAQFELHVKDVPVTVERKWALIPEQSLQTMVFTWVIVAEPLEMVSGDVQPPTRALQSTVRPLQDPSSQLK